LGPAARLRERAPLRAVPEPQRHLERLLAFAGIHPEDARSDRRIVLRKGPRVLTVRVEHDEAGVGCIAADFLRVLEAPAEQACNRAGLSAARVTKDGEMPPEQPVRIDARPGIASQWTRADLDVSPFSR